MTGFILIALGILCLAIIYFLTKQNEEKSKIKNDLLDYKLIDEAIETLVITIKDKNSDIVKKIYELHKENSEFIEWKVKKNVI